MSGGCPWPCSHLSAFPLWLHPGPFLPSWGRTALRALESKGEGSCFLGSRVRSFSAETGTWPSLPQETSGRSPLSDQGFQGGSDEGETGTLPEGKAVTSLSSCGEDEPQQVTVTSAHLVSSQARECRACTAPPPRGTSSLCTEAQDWPANPQHL